MSTSRDAIAEAVALSRKLAASHLVRRDEIDADLAAAPDEARRAALQAERATVEADLQAALREIKELQRLANTADAAVVPGVGIEEDPLTPSAETAALENVRAHIRSLESQVRVNDELRKVDDPGAHDAPDRPDVEGEPRPPSGPRRRTM